MKRIFTLAATASVVCAQTTTQPPLEVHRQPATVPSLSEIQAAAKLLSEGEKLAAPPAEPSLSVPASQPQPYPNTQEGPPLVEMPTKAPKGYKIRTDVPLDASTTKALEIATQFQERPNIPREGKDGRLIYTYGAGLPVLVCAPLRWCLVELLPGEIAKNAIPSDERWSARPLLDTSEEKPRSVIAMRPKYAGLDSSLVILTDQRSYFLRLISSPQRYMSRVAFEDPEAEQRKMTEAAWNLYHRQADALLLPKIEANPAPEKGKADDVIHPYTLSGEHGFCGKEKRPYFWPVAAYEKGGLVYITLPKIVNDRRSPSLQRIGTNGKLEPLNYSTEGNTFIAHTVESRMILLRGTGKQAEKVFLTKPEK